MRARLQNKFVFALLAMAVISCAGRVRAADDILDLLDQHLKFTAFDGNVQGRVSGLLDFEGYYLQQPPPGLIDTNHDFLFTPRLTVYLDAQIGSKLYFFAQGRIDRGFDPADKSLRARLDEYALRYTPLDSRFNLQVGKFNTVVGNWADRYDSWDNPFITAPLPYENLTNIGDQVALDDLSDLLYPTGSYGSHNPIIWGPSYATGASVSGKVEKFDYAVEVKNTSLSSRPDTWNITETGFQHPTVSGRIGYRPGEEWNLGFSASVGDYLQPGAAATIPMGQSFGDYREILLGQDLSYAWHHLQVWAEVFETRFQIPGAGNADTLAYYIEAKYKFTPQFSMALRWNQQLFNKVEDEDDPGEKYPWSDNIWRIDLGFIYRFTPRMQAKLQYSFMQLSGQEAAMYEHFVAMQFTVRF